MFKLNRQTEAFIDFSNLALGVFLFLSPWIFGFTSDLGWHTSWIAGTAISVIAIFMPNAVARAARTNLNEAVATTPKSAWGAEGAPPPAAT